MRTVTDEAAVSTITWIIAGTKDQATYGEEILGRIARRAWNVVLDTV